MGIFKEAVGSFIGMLGFKKIRVRNEERGLVWRDNEFVGIEPAGERWIFDPLSRMNVDIESRLEPWLRHDRLLSLLKSERLPAEEVGVAELNSSQRGLVWLDGRFFGILAPGRAAWWKGMIEVKIEIVDIRKDYGRFETDERDAILALAEAACNFDVIEVPPESKTAFSTMANWSVCCRPDVTCSGTPSPATTSSRSTCASKTSISEARIC